MGERERVALTRIERMSKRQMIELRDRKRWNVEWWRVPARIARDALSDSTPPERCPTCCKKRGESRIIGTSPRIGKMPCTDPFHTQDWVHGGESEQEGQ